jgi:hypothetical protein
MAKCDDEEPPPDVGPHGQFLVLLSDFLTNRAPGERKEDLLSGRPWEDVENNRWYFKIEALIKYFRIEGYRKYDGSESKLTQKIRELRGGPYQHNINNQAGGSVRCWYIPADVIKKIDALETPARKKDVI